MSSTISSRRLMPKGIRWRQCAAAGLLVAVVVLRAEPTGAQQASVVSTVHNLSITGPGSVRSVSETEVCKFCHVPHNALAEEPLWGHSLSHVPQYQVARLATTAGSDRWAPQPNGSSRLCLSCHDGTIALGDVAGETRPVLMSGSERLQAGDRGFIGTDLSGSHPISFVVEDDSRFGLGEWVDIGVKPLSAIASDPEVRLDDAGRMQCTTCHDPHDDRHYDPGRTPHFLVKPTVEALCLSCHELR